ncbi:MAG TPA: winged helix-turn-helix transcriptional regulator [Thermoplasmatales archaeon]|nr:winged helix-turn-helix transcriptional regulator [Thermoplasmatales archaeon]
MDLTNYEKKVLYGIAKFPNANDRQLAEKFGIKQSTVSAIRKRLKDEGYYRVHAVPMIQNFGAEIMTVTYTNFNPVIPLEKRIEITEKKIEASEEIFFSMGEEDKGFSIGFAQNYTVIGKINDIRTMTFGSLGLLDKEYPKEIIFPFKESKTYRFFNFAPLLSKIFGINDDEVEKLNFFPVKNANLSIREKKILCRIVEFPDASSKEIAEKMGITRHTVGRLKRKFMENEYIKMIAVPDFEKLGFKILAFYHINLNPHSPPNFEKDELSKLLLEDFIFFASRHFEFAAISMHSSYEDYKICKTSIIQKLKENEWITTVPTIRTYSLHKAKIIKSLTFSPITKKILKC